MPISRRGWSETQHSSDAGLFGGALAGLQQGLIRTAAAAVVSLLAIAPTNTFAQDLQTIKVGLASESLLAAAPRLADELGLFQKHGLKPDFVVLGSSNMSTTALISGSVEFAQSTPPDTITAAGRGVQVKWLATIYLGYGQTMTISKAAAEEAGIPTDAPLHERYKALDGLTLASPSATSPSTIGPKEAAKSVGASPKFTYMAFPAMLAAFESGVIDGFIASSPVWYQPIEKGTGVVWLSGPNGDFPADTTPAATSVLQVMAAYADANRETTMKVAHVFDDLTVLINEKPDVVRAAVGKLFPNIDTKALDILFEIDARGWAAPPPSAELVAHEIDVVKRANGEGLPGLSSVTPDTLIYARK
jgi:ABC-type nitrate/sulfonate/bicarbonate transport system substrate-binding protein